MTTAPGPMCRYRYDALDLITSLECAGQASVQRFYRHQHLVTERQGQASQSVFQQDEQLLAVQSSENDTLKNQLLATDQQRSVLQLIDSLGRLSQVYTAYGHPRAESGLSSLLGFNGERRDPVTGHYLLGNGHRAYNPVLMRFNSPDRLSPFGQGGLNSYAYCLGDPVNFSDPTGAFADIGRLATSLLNVANAKIVMSPAIPYKLAKEALQWGAAGHLPGKYTIGAFGSTVAGAATMVGAFTGVAAAIATITEDTESAKTLMFIALGIGSLTVVSRLGSKWAARDPNTIPALRNFVDSRKYPAGVPGPTLQAMSPTSHRPSALVLPSLPESPIASAPLPTPVPISPRPTAPPLTPFFLDVAPAAIRGAGNANKGGRHGFSSRRVR